MAEQVKKDPGKGAERLANALAGVIERESQRQEVLQQQLQQQAMIEAQRTFEMQKQSMQQNFMQVLEEQKNKFAERIHREEMALRRNQQAQNQLNADREFGLSERQFQELQNRNKLEAERLASIKKTAEMDFLLKTANSLNDGIQSALGNPEYQNHLIGIQQGIYNMLSKRYGLQPPAPAPPPGAQTDATEQPAAAPGAKSDGGGSFFDFFGVSRGSRGLPGLNVGNRSNVGGLGAIVANLFGKDSEETGVSEEDKSSFLDSFPGVKNALEGKSKGLSPAEVSVWNKFQKASALVFGGNAPPNASLLKTNKKAFERELVNYLQKSMMMKQEAPSSLGGIIPFTPTGFAPGQQALGSGKTLLGLGRGTPALPGAPSGIPQPGIGGFPPSALGGGRSFLGLPSPSPGIPTMPPGIPMPPAGGLPNFNLPALPPGNGIDLNLLKELLKAAQ